MPGSAESGAERGTAAGLVADWANAVCLAPSSSETDIARVLSLNVSTARHSGRQRMYLAPEPASHVTFVLGPNDRTVLFVELVTVAPVSLNELTARFGAGREAPHDAYHSAPTIVFDSVEPPNAARACSVLARAAAEDPDPTSLRRFILYVRPGSWDEPGDPSLSRP